MTVFVLLTACVLTLETRDKAVDEPGPVTGVDVHLDSGDVTATGEVGGTAVHADLHAEFAGAEPTLTFGLAADSTWSMESLCPDGWVICSVTADLTVPAEATFVARTGSGEVSVTGLTGGVDLETGSGDVSADGVSGLAVFSTGSGDIEVRRSALAEMKASTGSGDLTVRLTAAPTRAELSTGSGDIELTVPAGTYALAVDVGSGDVHVDDGIVVDSTAEAVLSLSTGSGDVVVHAE